MVTGPGPLRESGAVNEASTVDAASTVEEKPTPVLECRSVRKVFRGTTVLDGLNLTVAEHDVVVLIGASGSGKSTLLRCINLLETVDDGDILLDGEEITDPRVNPDKVTEKTFRRYLDEPDIPDVDLFLRSSGEQRISNFLLWQSAYAEMVFLNQLWPDFDRRDLWQACEIYAKRDRRYGGAIPNEVAFQQAAAGQAQGQEAGRASS